jgi:hypothetical protein
VIIPLVLMLGFGVAVVQLWSTSGSTTGATDGPAVPDPVNAERVANGDLAPPTETWPVDCTAITAAKADSRPVNSFIHPAGLPITHLSIKVLRQPVESALGATIPVEHDPGRVTAPFTGGHGQGISDQFGAHVSGHRPADHSMRRACWCETPTVST